MGCRSLGCRDLLHRDNVGIIQGCGFKSHTGVSRECALQGWGPQKAVRNYTGKKQETEIESRCPCSTSKSQTQTVNPKTLNRVPVLKGWGRRNTGTFLGKVMGIHSPTLPEAPVRHQTLIEPILQALISLDCPVYTIPPQDKCICVYIYIYSFAKHHIIPRNCNNLNNRHKKL